MLSKKILLPVVAFVMASFVACDDSTSASASEKSTTDELSANVKNISDIDDDEQTSEDTVSDSTKKSPLADSVTPADSVAQADSVAGPAKNSTDSVVLADSVAAPVKNPTDSVASADSVAGPVVIPLDTVILSDSIVGPIVNPVDSVLPPIDSLSSETGLKGLPACRGPYAPKAR